MASPSPNTVHEVTLPDGTRVPSLGVGTWTMGEHRARAAREVSALVAAFDLGLTLVDTAEMYGDGGAEEVLAQAMQGRRDRLFVVGKVYPHNAGRKSAISACERSLARLRTDRIDLYLLHWRGSIPLAETVEAFERLRADGKILHWGVSNFDTDDMRELFALPDGQRCAVNQVLYHLRERGIEWELLPWLAAHRVPAMAYSPLGQGVLPGNRALGAIARDIGATTVQVALAWLLRRRDVIAIPQSADLSHVRDIAGAVAMKLSRATLERLDAAFPPPAGPQPLRMT